MFSTALKYTNLSLNICFYCRTVPTILGSVCHRLNILRCFCTIFQCSSGQSISVQKSTSGWVTTVEHTAGEVSVPKVCCFGVFAWSHSSSTTSNLPAQSVFIVQGFICAISFCAGLLTVFLADTIIYKKTKT